LIGRYEYLQVDPMKGLLEVKDSMYGQYAVFEIPLVTGENVYMRAQHLYAGIHQWYVVIVDRIKFFELWSLEPYSGENRLALGDQKVWESDYKYQDAENGFSKGYDNPVPLPTVLCSFDEESNRYFASINDGITRTIWLASKGAEFVPMLCRSRDGADKLHELVGVDEQSIVQLVKLVKYA
ncbi:plasmid fertility inhibition factor family protein, partial [Vibrio gallaecicus]